jgi:hypothetical protein
MEMGELVILAVIACVCGFPIVGSLIGIQRAIRRRREEKRSVGAVVAASFAGLIALSTIGRSAWPLSAAACVLSLAWIITAAHANREATGMARRKSPEPHQD